MAKPELECNGKCQLVKELKAVDVGDSQMPVELLPTFLSPFLVNKAIISCVKRDYFITNTFHYLGNEIASGFVLQPNQPPEIFS